MTVELLADPHGQAVQPRIALVCGWFVKNITEQIVVEYNFLIKYILLVRSKVCILLRVAGMCNNNQDKTDILVEKRHDQKNSLLI